MTDDSLWLGNPNRAGLFRRRFPVVIVMAQAAIWAVETWGQHRYGRHYQADLPLFVSLALILPAAVGGLYELLTPPRSRWRLACYITTALLFSVLILTA
jgi:hypothetical protein